MFTLDLKDLAEKKPMLFYLIAIPIGLVIAAIITILVMGIGKFILMYFSGLIFPLIVVVLVALIVFLLLNWS